MRFRPFKKLNLKSSSGQTLVETAVSFALFLLVMISIMDLSYLFFVKLTLQNAARQGGRYAITGQAISGQSRYNSILKTVEDTSLGLATSSNTAICSASGGCSNAGGPSDTVTITVTYNYGFLTSLIAHYFNGGSYTIKVSSSFKNEAFPPSQS